MTLRVVSMLCHRANVPFADSDQSITEIRTCGVPCARSQHKATYQPPRVAGPIAPGADPFAPGARAARTQRGPVHTRHTGDSHPARARHTGDSHFARPRPAARRPPGSPRARLGAAGAPGPAANAQPEGL